MKNLTLGNNLLVDVGGGIETERHRLASKCSEEIIEKMDFEEIVEEGKKNKGKP